MNKKGMYWIILVLMFIGLGVSIHLLQIDYNVKFDANYVPSCDVNDTVSCSKVAESKHSSLAGVPVASWGILGYLFVIIFMFTSRKSKRFYSSLALFFFIFSAGSIYFFVIAKFVIEAFCVYCITTYIVNWLAFILVLISIFKFKHDDEKFSLVENFKSLFDIPFVIIPLYLVIGLGIVLPSYMIFSGSHDVSSLTKYKNARFNEKELYGICGAEEADVKIILYSDYECPYCERFETTIKKIIKNFSNVELIRKEFPLDNKCNMLINKEFHKYACDAALFAKCSGVQGKFWEAADLLHLNKKDLKPNDLMKYVSHLKLNKKQIQDCMKSETTMNRVKLDIKEGLKAGVKGTPGFVVNGKTHSGAQPYEKVYKIVIEAGGKPLPGLAIKKSKK